MIEVRILRKGDEDLLVRAVLSTSVGSITRDEAVHHLTNPTLINVVSTECDEVAGFIYGYVLRRFGTVSFFIYSVDVVKKFRRRGVGKAMFSALREYGRSAGWNEMFVLTSNSNGPAMALYQSAGGVRPYPDDVMFDFYL